MRVATCAGLLAISGAATAAPVITGDTSRPINGAGGPGAPSSGAFADRDGLVVFSQAPAGDGATGYPTDAIDGQFYGQRLADNFMLDSSAEINGVRWWGSSENYFNADLSNFDSFVVSFLADDAGLPGMTVAEFTFTLGQTNPIDTGTVSIADAPQYVFEAKFDSFMLEGGVTYWLSIGSINVAADGDAFVWTHSSGGDSTIASDFFDGTGFQRFDNDPSVAFEIQAVPSPGAATLIGLAGLVALRRRR